MSNQYKIPDYEAEQKKSKNKKQKIKPKPKEESEDDEEEEEQKEEDDDVEENNNQNNYVRNIAQKEIKKYTKKRIEKSVFERFGIWLNKASKLNFE